MDVTWEWLRTIPLFESLDAETGRTLAGEVRAMSYAKGRTLFLEGEPCEGFWIVKEGSVNVFNVGSEGRVHILCRNGLRGCPYEQGEHFGLVSALDGGGYPASAETREPSVLVLVPRESVMRLAEEQPGFALAIARHFSRCLRCMTNKASTLALRDVRERLAAYILEEAAQQHATQNGGQLVLTDCQEEIAQRIGTVREVLARALRTLRHLGLIEQRGSRVRVTDAGGLRAMAKGNPPRVAAPN